MRAVTKPNPEHVYNSAIEITALQTYCDTEPNRAIPPDCGWRDHERVI